MKVRKTTNTAAKMLTVHGGLRHSILDSNVSDKEKVQQLKVINSMIESLLHEQKCYQGFKYVINPDTTKPDYLDSIEENARIYIGLLG